MDTKLNFKQQASILEAKIRGLAPTPGAWFEYRNERFKVFNAKVVEGIGKAGSIINENLTIACGDNALSILEIQRQGKGIMNISNFVKGYRFKKGDTVNQPTH